MSQLSLLPVKVTAVVPSSQVGLDGADLKWVARGDDGHDYAMKTIEDSETLPLSEWVCYALWAECGLPVPDCAALAQQGKAPAFGSRIELRSSQLPKGNAAHYTVVQYFGAHRADVAKLYPADAFLPNVDRHGRNVLFRQQLTGTVMVCIDFSRAWLQTGKPFGDMTNLAGSNTQAWWQFFRDQMSVAPDHSSLDKILALPDEWMLETIGRAPPEWSSSVNLTAVDDFWRQSRQARGADAKMWL